jgi:hypothetical protein
MVVMVKNEEVKSEEFVTRSQILCSTYMKSIYYCVIKSVIYVDGFTIFFMNETTISKTKEANNNSG